MLQNSFILQKFFSKDSNITIEDASKNLDANMRFIEGHNARADRKEVSYREDVWEYSDLSTVEINENMNGFVALKLRSVSERFNFFPNFQNVSIPNAINWTSRGAVTPVGKQVNVN